MTFRPMRRFRQALPEEECFRILKGAYRGFLSVNGEGGYPYTVPINFVFDDGKAYFHCAKEGHKLDAIRACDKASFCVLGEGTQNPGEWWYYFTSVICFGRVRVLEDREEALPRLQELAEKYNPSAADIAADMAKNAPRAEVLEFTIEHMTGKRVQEK